MIDHTGPSNEQAQTEQQSGLQIGSLVVERVEGGRFECGTVISIGMINYIIQ